MKPSVTKTASACILESKGLFYGILLTTDATNAVTLDIYDSTTASGTKIIPTSTITTNSADRLRSLSFALPLHVSNGIYVNVTCSGTVTYMVYFEER